MPKLTLKQIEFWKKQMKDRNITMANLAERIGSTAGSVSHQLRGRDSISDERYAQFVKHLGDPEVDRSEAATASVPNDASSSFDNAVFDNQVIDLKQESLSANLGLLQTEVSGLAQRVAALEHISTVNEVVRQLPDAVCDDLEAFRRFEADALNLHARCHHLFQAAINRVLEATSRG